MYSLLYLSIGCLSAIAEHCNDGCESVIDLQLGAQGGASLLQVNSRKGEPSVSQTVQQASLASKSHHHRHRRHNLHRLHKKTGPTENSSSEEGLAQNSSEAEGSAQNSTEVEGPAQNSSEVEGSAQNSTEVEGPAQNSSEGEPSALRSFIGSAKDFLVGSTNTTEQTEEVPPESKAAQIEAAWATRGLHSVVGEDGVLMISLNRSMQRYDSSSAKLLKNAFIHTTHFPATDGKDPSVTVKELERACIKNCGLTSQEHGRAFASLAHSHMLAVEAAGRRTNSAWTAILEDDAVPIQMLDVVGPGGPIPSSVLWVEAFEKAWSQMPPQAKFVRLGYCHIYMPNKPPSTQNFVVNKIADAGVFKLSNWSGVGTKYTAGGCTHAYLVHKSIIPQLLGQFPCHSSLDSCYAGKVYPTDFGHPYDIDSQLTPDQIFTASHAAKGNHSWYVHVLPFGVLQQDWEDLPEGATKACFQEKGGCKGFLQMRVEALATRSMLQSASYLVE
jgi:hypothetical protein